MEKYLTDYLIERIKTCHNVAEWSSRAAAAKQKARAAELSDLLGKIRSGVVIVSSE